MKVRVEVNNVYEQALLSKKRYIVLRGGAGSGKSVFTAQKKLIRCLQEPGHRFLVLRKVANTLRPSVFQLFVDLIYRYGFDKMVKINKTDMRLTFANGSEIILMGMDDPEKVKSIAGITGIWCEEATEFDEKDFNQLELRVRGETDYYKQFILTFNPIHEEHWLKARFFDQHDEDVLTLTTTYLDNPFLDSEYIKHLTGRVKNDENLYRIYVLGEWGKPRTGGEFYKLFDFSRDTGEYKYNPELALHLSFDFNTRPGMHALVFQVVDKTIYCIRDIQTTSPNNTTKGLCKEFERIYQNHVSGLFVYGDPSGKHEDTRTEQGWNDFRIIEQALAKYKPVMRLLTSAPSVSMRGQFINSVFADNFDELKILIDNGCKGFINDLSYIQEAADGTKHKQKVKGEDGISYEKWGHYSDCLDYFICKAFETSFIKYQKGDIKQPFVLGASRINSKW
jgi:phage terminase large subunit